MLPIRLLGPKVLVALEPKATAIEDSTGMNYHDVGRQGPIILAQPTDMYDADEHSRGLVIALGEKKGTVELDKVRDVMVRAFNEGTRTSDLFTRIADLAPAEFDVEVGDVVLFAPSAGVSLGEQEDGITYVVLHEKDLMAVIQPKSEAA